MSMDNNYKNQPSDKVIMGIYYKDKAAGQEKMLEKYTDYIYYVISKTYPTFRTETEDMFQSGVIGIIHAMQTYNPEKGAFTTHCTPYIKKEISKHIRFLSSESSEYFAAVHNTVSRAKTQIEAAGDEVTVEKVMVETGLSQKIVTRELNVDHAKVSYDSLENMTATTPFDDALEIEDLLSCIPESARAIVKMKVFEDMSFTAIAQQLGKSIKTVRREYGQSIETLRRQMSA